MNMKKQIGLNAALTGLLLAGVAHAADKKAAAPQAKAEAGTCTQANECKGHGSCKGASNECKGKNSCHAHKMTADKAACDSIKGAWTAAAAAPAHK